MRGEWFSRCNARGGAARIARMVARDVGAFCALIAWYAALLALGLTLAFALFPGLPAPGVVP